MGLGFGLSLLVPLALGLLGLVLLDPDPLALIESGPLIRKVDTRLPGKGNSNSRGARPVYSFR